MLVEVNDSGIGMEPEALTRVFNAFEQEERSITRQFGGLGLGLAISKALVEMHGGTIKAQSEGRDRGATFRVRLPLVAPAEQREVPAAPPRPASCRPSLAHLAGGRPPRHGEDHAERLGSRKVTRRVGRRHRHGAGTGGPKHFDLLMSDLGLPDGSGHDLMRQLRERGHKFPAIALSGYGQEEDIRRSHEAGFAAHLTKPASREAVVEAIAAAMPGKPRRSRLCPSILRVRAVDCKPWPVRYTGRGCTTKSNDRGKAMEQQFWHMIQLRTWV